MAESIPFQPAFVPPIEGSSVPAGVDRAYAYARRLELRYYKDQEKLLTAHRRVQLALNELRELPLSRQRATAEAALHHALECLL